MNGEQTTNIIETSGLSKRYGSTWALRACSLAIPAGHVAALVGPNGAGKTTLLNLAVGLAAPSAGAVTVLGGWPAGRSCWCWMSRWRCWTRLPGTTSWPR